MFGSSNYEYQTPSQPNPDPAPPHPYQAPSAYHPYPPPYQRLPQLRPDAPKMLPLQYQYTRPAPEPDLQMGLLGSVPVSMPPGTNVAMAYGANVPLQPQLEPPLRQLPHELHQELLQAPKFCEQDVELLRQLLNVGEKHKWKQITKEINLASPHNAQFRQGELQGQVLTKNVSPTFVIKQYQTLLGLPNNATYFGTLGSSLPYVVSPNGWDDLNYQEFHHNFNNDLE